MALEIETKNDIEHHHPTITPSDTFIKKNSFKNSSNTNFKKKTFKYFIYTLKDFSQDNKIKNSRYYSQIEALKYEDINENLMKNLFILYKLIINKGDEKK